MAGNVLRVYVRWRLEAQTFQLRRKFDRRTNVELTTKPPLAYTRCYAQYGLFSTKLNTKHKKRI